MSATDDSQADDRGRVSVERRNSAAAAFSDHSGARGPTFFMPGVEGGTIATERAYAALRESVQTRTSLTPRARRIFNVACRMGGKDVTFEVGMPSPTGEGTVLAILDLGGSDPYSIQFTGGAPEQRLSRRVYSVTEFQAT